MQRNKTFRYRVKHGNIANTYYEANFSERSSATKKKDVGDGLRNYPPKKLSVA